MHDIPSTDKEPYKVKLKQFEGPLDVLLSLIEERKLHINDISLAHITDDYLSYIEHINAFPVKEAAHFILVAATLVLIKSRSLLPTLTLTEEEEGDIKDLERRLIEYKRIKELSEYVRVQFDKQVILLPTHAMLRVAPVFSPTKKITISFIQECIRNILRSLPVKEAIPQIVLKKVASLEETIHALLERVKKDFHIRFKDFAKKGEGKASIITSFLAVLELLRRGIISVKQEGRFADIIIKNNEL